MPVFGNAVSYCCVTVSVSFPLVDHLDISSTANLYKSLAQTAPEIKQCVDACNFIAESTRQQNNIGSVSDFKLGLPIIFAFKGVFLNAIL